MRILSVSVLWLPTELLRVHPNFDTNYSGGPGWRRVEVQRARTPLSVCDTPQQTWHDTVVAIRLLSREEAATRVPEGGVVVGQVGVAWRFREPG